MATYVAKDGLTLRDLGSLNGGVNTMTPLNPSDAQRQAAAENVMDFDPSVRLVRDDTVIALGRNPVQVTVTA